MRGAERHVTEIDDAVKAVFLWHGLGMIRKANIITFLLEGPLLTRTRTFTRPPPKAFMQSTLQGKRFGIMSPLEGPTTKSPWQETWSWAQASMALLLQ